ncbi:MAG TPA: TRAP transporter small permease subunit [Limnobacter sp.]|uniref:TRAP transporter small permease subunit n=1 Tax=Limnobacter sp. TaxID=2003368 RepID=UPI002E34C092|nr:TRAP transporter small permease subunit [Limnobacter sp.]HEX5485600.1 TRAP transporter small permease subunit [Limnobacter sp.]
MKALLALSAGIDRLNTWIGRCVGWLVLLVTLVSAYNAVVRKAFNISTNGLLEIQWYLFGAVFLLGAAFTLKDNAHVRIDILSSRFSNKTRALIDIIGYVLFILPLVCFVLYHGSLFLYNSYSIHEYSADAGGLLRWPAKALIVIGFALLGLQVLSELIKKADYLKHLRAEQSS